MALCKGAISSIVIYPPICQEIMYVRNVIAPGIYKVCPDYVFQAYPCNVVNTDFYPVGKNLVRSSISRLARLQPPPLIQHKITH